MLEAMATLKGVDAKPALKQCVRAPITSVRRHAVAVLAPLCGVAAFVALAAALLAFCVKDPH